MIQKKKCEARKPLKIEAMVSKIGVETVENKPRKGSEKFEGQKKIYQFTVIEILLNVC